MKTKKKSCCRAWEVNDILQKFEELKRQVEYLKTTTQEQLLTIYSADTDICIGHRSKDWHRIVCIYKDDICTGVPRKHWTSKWLIMEDGFTLRAMYPEDYKGWHGQYDPNNTLKYDQLPRDILQLHHNKLVEHIKTLGIYYPCHIYDDINSVLYRP